MFCTSAWLDSAHLDSFAAQQTDAFRAGGSAEAWVDWWGGEVVISAPAESIGRSWEKQFTEWEESVGWPARRVYFRQLQNNPVGSRGPELWRGPQEKPRELVVQEKGLRFLVHPGGGYSAGLFPDQRENRRFLREILASIATKTSDLPRVLNLFAYTCAFSVAAASVGAHTLSVDLSGRFLGWGQENFRLNELSQEGHRWWAEDVLRVLPRLQRRGEDFDVIVLDPPTFSRGHKGQVFRFGEAVSDLLEWMDALLRPGGWLLLSTNSRDHSPGILRTIVDQVLPEWKKEAGRIPDDFATARGLSCSSTLWLQKP